MFLKQFWCRERVIRINYLLLIGGRRPVTILPLYERKRVLANYFCWMSNDLTLLWIHGMYNFTEVSYVIQDLI